MFSGHLLYLISTLVCSDNEQWCYGLLLSSVNEGSSSALFQRRTPATFQEKCIIRLTAELCQMTTATQSDIAHTCVVFRHGSAYTCWYIGINAKEHDLWFSGELLGSIIVITINRSFHRTFSKLKYKHLLMLTTLLKHSWAENIF